MHNNQFSVKNDAGYQTIWIEDLDSYCLQRSFKINIFLEIVRKYFHFVQEILEGTVYTLRLPSFQGSRSDCKLEMNTGGPIGCDRIKLWSRSRLVLFPQPWESQFVTYTYRIFMTCVDFASQSSAPANVTRPVRLSIIKLSTSPLSKLNICGASSEVVEAETNMRQMDNISNGIHVCTRIMLCCTVKPLTVCNQDSSFYARRQECLITLRTSPLKSGNGRGGIGSLYFVISPMPDL